MAKKCEYSVPHQHGTKHDYLVHGCRCDPCKANYSKYQKLLRARREKGMSGRISASFAQQLIRMMTRRGLSLEEIAERAKVNPFTLVRILRGNQETVSSATFVKLMNTLETLLDAEK